MSENQATAPTQKPIMVIGTGLPLNTMPFMASLLDAHQNMECSHNFNVLLHIKNNPDVTLGEMLTMIREHSAGESTELNGFYTLIEESHQGKPANGMCFGGMKGGASKPFFAHNYSVLYQLEQTLGVEVRLVHVLANPYWASEQLLSSDDDDTGINEEKGTLGRAVTKLLNYYRDFDHLRASKRFSIIEFTIEDLLSEPQKVMLEVFNFLGLEADDSLLATIQASFEKPIITIKTKENWGLKEGLRIRIEESISRYPFLSAYRNKPESQKTQEPKEPTDQQEVQNE